MGILLCSHDVLQRRHSEQHTTLQEHNDPRVLVAYSDASFAPDGAKSHQGIILTLGSVPIFWKSQRQTIVALSTAESELIAECDAFVAQKGLAELLHELSPEIYRKVLAVDNAAAVAISQGTNGPTPWRTRHLKVKAAALIEAVEENVIEVIHCPGVTHVADIATKTLGTVILKRLMFLLMLLSQAEVSAASRVTLPVVTVIFLADGAEAQQDPVQQGWGQPVGLYFCLFCLMIGFGHVCYCMWWTYRAVRSNWQWLTLWAMLIYRLEFILAWASGFRWEPAPEPPMPALMPPAPATPEPPVSVASGTPQSQPDEEESLAVEESLHTEAQRRLGWATAILQELASLWEQGTISMLGHWGPTIETGDDYVATELRQEASIQAPRNSNEQPLGPGSSPGDRARRKARRRVMQDAHRKQQDLYMGHGDFTPEQLSQGAFVPERPISPNYSKWP